MKYVKEYLVLNVGKNLTCRMESAVYFVVAVIKLSVKNVIVECLVRNLLMKIAILGSWNYERLSAVMENLISESQCFLFTVVCGGTSEEGIYNSVGYKWATANGAPVKFLIQENVDKLIDKLTQEIDFIVVMQDDNPIIKRIIMKMNMLGKHGRVEI